MPGVTVKVLLQDIRKLETDALIVGFYDNVRPLKDLAGELDWLLCGSLSNLIITHKLVGTLGDIALLTSQGKLPARKIFMLGLGPKDGVTASVLTSATKNVIFSVLNAGVKNVAVEFFQVASMPYDISVPAVLQGLSEGARGKHIAVTLLAPDAVALEHISKFTGQESISAT